MNLVPGSIGWHDLSVVDAPRLRDFYSSVLGWQSEPVDMGAYDDFNMIPAGGVEAVAGVCHARGIGSLLPPVWLVYFVVDDLDRAIMECLRGGGELVVPERAAGGGRYCVIRDPAGAFCALYQVT